MKTGKRKRRLLIIEQAAFCFTRSAEIIQSTLWA
jgi:hypothetical protein